MLPFNGSRWIIVPYSARFSLLIQVSLIKDDEQYLDTVDDNKTASVLPLQGKTNELGIYECRWNNSRGEARHRRFIVSFIFVGTIDSSGEAKSFVAINGISINGISITFALLFAIGVGISIKIYLDKVSDGTEFFSQQANPFPSFDQFENAIQLQSSFRKRWRNPLKIDWMATQAKSTRMCRWNVKRNFCPTTRNGNSLGKDSDSVRASLFLL